MKKTLVIISIIIVIFFAALILIPVLFKGKIVTTVKEQANNNLNAIVNFDEDIKLSLLKSFPNFFMEIKELSIANKAPFEGDTLANIGKLEVKLNFVQAIKGNFEVKSLTLTEPVIYTHVLNDTIDYTANWDITIPSDEVEEDEPETDEETSDFSLPIHKYTIKNGSFVYDDELYDMKINMNGLNLSGSGDFSEDIFDMVLQVAVDKFDFIYDGIKYLNQVNTRLDAILGMDLNLLKFTFKENILELNNLQLSFDGFLAVPDDIEMDLAFSSPNTDFKNLISLIPAIYYKDFESLEADGSMEFNGKAKGIYNDSLMPAFDINLAVNDGMFKYPDLPMPVNNVNLKVNVNSPDENIDHMVVDLSSLYFEFGKEAFDAKMLLKTIASDPYVDATIKGKVDIANIKQIIPMEEEIELSGIINTNLSLKGNSSSIEREAYEEFHASGNVSVKELKYFYPDLEKDIEIPSMMLDFSPEHVRLSDFAMAIDKNELAAKGLLYNFIPYLFNDGTLYGELDVSSSFFNLNPFIVSDEGKIIEETSPDTASYEMEVVELPKDINFKMNAEFNRLIYDQMDMTNVVCKLSLMESVLTIEDLIANVFNGSIAMDGSYDTRDMSKPMADFNLNITDFNIKNTFTTFEVVKKYVPIAQFIEGNFDGKLRLNTALGQDMMPDLESLFSKGKLTIDMMKVQDFKPLSMMANTLDIKELQNLALKNINPSYKIENGRYYFTEPVKFSVDNYKFEVMEGSSNGLDKSIDYDIIVEMPSEKLKKESGKLLKQLSNQNVDIPLGQTVTVFVKMTGTIDQPKIATSMEKMVDNAKEELKEKAKKEVEKKKQELEEEAKKEAERLKQEAEEKARKEAERLKKEAEEKARKEAEKQKKKLEEDAKKKLKEIWK